MSICIYVYIYVYIFPLKRAAQCDFPGTFRKIKNAANLSHACANISGTGWYIY